MKWKKSELVILGCLGMVAVVAIIALGSIGLEYLQGKSTYRKLEEYVFLPEETAEEQPFAPNRETEDTEKEVGQTQNNAEMSASKDENAAEEMIVHYGQSPQVNFEALKTVNSDVIGWIYGPDSVINYPVVQGDDNDYYLTHMFDGKENKCGSIFMDSLNEENFSNANTILHGHHMKNGTMFAGLMKYGEQSYYDSHPVMWLVTPEKTYCVEIFAGFVTSADSQVWQLEFATEEAHQNWLDMLVQNSAFSANVKPDTTDKILTLATCSYEYDDARFVVMGILRE